MPIPCLPESLRQSPQVFPGGENPVRPNQSADLKDQGEKCGVINEPRARKKIQRGSRWSEAPRSEANSRRRMDAGDQSFIGAIIARQILRARVDFCLRNS